MTNTTVSNQQPLTSVRDSEAETIRLTRRELANRYGSRGTTEQLRAALTVLQQTARGGQAA